MEVIKQNTRIYNFEDDFNSLITQNKISNMMTIFKNEQINIFKEENLIEIDFIHQSNSKLLIFRFHSSFLSDGVVDILIDQAGIYEYYISYDNGSNEKKRYIIVDPLLKSHGKTELKSLDEIKLITVAPKLFGLFTHWKSHLEEIAQLGYNFIHFIPIQQRGQSNSSYSIRNQLII